VSGGATDDLVPVPAARRGRRRGGRAAQPHTRAVFAAEDEQLCGFEDVDGTHGIELSVEHGLCKPGVCATLAARGREASGGGPRAEA